MAATSIRDEPQLYLPLTAPLEEEVDRTPCDEADRLERPHLKVKPFLKWAGGKTQLLGEITRRLPHEVGRYFEPFAGSAALYFYLTPRTAFLNDSNEELMLTYRVVRDQVQELLSCLTKYERAHRQDSQHYYRTRAAQPHDEVERAARFIYLNRTCYNGLYRVNKSGQFNVPLGRYANPSICNAELLRSASAALAGASLWSGDYHNQLAWAQRGDFVYLDPPYCPVSRYSDFKRYTKEFFYEDDQRELASVMADLTRRGCNVLLSNSAAPLVYDLYAGRYTVERVQARRNINKVGSRRQAIDELLIRNY